MPDHYATGGLRCEEGGLQIYLHRQVIVIFSDILGQVAGSDAGIVHQNIEPPEVLHRVVDGSGDLILLHQVHLQRQSAAAQSGDFMRQVALGFDVAQSEGNIGASIGECESDGVS